MQLQFKTIYKISGDWLFDPEQSARLAQKENGRL